nr:MAG TPA: hypothetical protein [Caudoviricetes sp.]
MGLEGVLLRQGRKNFFKNYFPIIPPPPLLLTILSWSISHFYIDSIPVKFFIGWVTPQTSRICLKKSIVKFLTSK